MDKKFELGKIGRMIQDKPYDALLILAFLIVTIILLRLYWNVNENDGQWERFRTEHDCQLRMSKTGTQRASWHCDDGKTYYRWRQQR